MRKRFWLAIAITLFVASAANAQPGGRTLFPWWDNPLAQNLNLTEAQRNQIRDVVKEYRNRLVDARAAVEKAEGDLEDIFGEETLDQRKGAEATERLASARGELTKALSQMSLRMRSVLTLQQWQELQRREGRGSGQNSYSRRRQGGRSSSGSGSGPPPGGPNAAPPAAGTNPPPPPSK